MPVTASFDDWFEPKRYLHFDFRLIESDRLAIADYVGNPKLISRHNFFPLILTKKPKFKVRETEEEVRYLDEDERPICFASHRDSQIYSYYAKILGDLYETTVSEVGIGDAAIAFRKIPTGEVEKSKCNIHLANDAFNEIRKIGNCHVYTFDVSRFFDSLDWKYLKRAWASLLSVDALPEDHYAIYMAISRFTTVEQKRLYELLGISKRGRKNGKPIPRVCSIEEFRSIVRKSKLIEKSNCGIPQGTSISSVLANLYMMEFDFFVSARAREAGGRLFRYCDDIFIVIPSENNFDVSKFVGDQLNKIGLSMNTDKSETSKFEKIGDSVKTKSPVQYLGFVFDGQDVEIRSGSIAGFVRDARASIKLAAKTRARFNSVRKSKGLAPQGLYKKRLFNRFTHVGSCNFPSYGLRAAEVMNSERIRRQMKGLDRLVRNEISNADFMTVEPSATSSPTTAD